MCLKTSFWYVANWFRKFADDIAHTYKNSKGDLLGELEKGDFTVEMAIFGVFSTFPTAAWLLAKRSLNNSILSN